MNGNQLVGDILDADSWPKTHSFKSESNLKTENRCYLVVNQAHLLVAEFCVQSLRAITGTLFHFWVIKVFYFNFFCIVLIGRVVDHLPGTTRPNRP